MKYLKVKSVKYRYLLVCPESICEEIALKNRGFSDQAWRYRGNNIVGLLINDVLYTKLSLLEVCRETVPIMQKRNS